MNSDIPEGLSLYFVSPGGDVNLGLPNVIELPQELAYLGPGDVLAVSADGRRLRVLWRHSSRQNSLLLTEQCDNYCLMCSQPPKTADDRWLLDQAFEVVGLIPDGMAPLTFTGGEPTIFGHEFISLLAYTRDRLPSTDVHILSNGRRFADFAFASSYAAVENPRMMVGIPIYGAEPLLHDYVVQAGGAFEETVSGILNLEALGQRVELRVVLHKQTVPFLVQIADFISRNLPFVDQVALMGLEMTGLARANVDAVWIDPYDYRRELSEAALLLDSRGIPVRIYNHQLCLIERRVWSLAVRSISDWKNEYMAECLGCSVMAECGGLFSSARYRTSCHITRL